LVPDPDASKGISSWHETARTAPTDVGSLEAQDDDDDDDKTTPLAPAVLPQAVVAKRAGDRTDVPRNRRLMCSPVSRG